MKQSSLNAPRGGTADASHRKNMTYSIQNKHLTAKSNTEVVRSSAKHGSKRRASSNHTTDKKLNLDKFLSVVQQRSNFTPSNQINGRMAPQGIAHLYKSNEDKKSAYNTTNISTH